MVEQRIIGLAKPTKPMSNERPNDTEEIIADTYQVYAPAERHRLTINQVLGVHSEEEKRFIRIRTILGTKIYYYLLGASFYTQTPEKQAMLEKQSRETADLVQQELDSISILNRNNPRNVIVMGIINRTTEEMEKKAEEEKKGGIIEGIWNKVRKKDEE